MFKKTKLCIVLGALSAVSISASASTDIRGAGMGGTGVSAASYLAAPLYNPALLASNYDNSDDLGVLLPSIDVTAKYPSSDPLGKLNSFLNINDSLKASDAEQANLLKDQWIDALKKVDGHVNASVDAGAVIAIPNQYIGLALSTSGHTDIFADLNQNADDFAVHDFTNYKMKSNADFVIGGSYDFGLTLAKQYSIGNGSTWSFGITPKVQTVFAGAYQTSVDTFDKHDITDQLKDSETSVNGFNMDFGAAFSPSQDTKVGLSVKNVLSKSVTSPLTHASDAHTYTVRPEVTLSTAYTGNNITITTDIDVTKRSGFDDIDHPHQFMRFGVEGDAFGWVQLRAGLSHNIKDSSDDMVTVGMGLHPFKLFGIDLAAGMGKNDNYTAGVQMSLTI